MTAGRETSVVATAVRRLRAEADRVAEGVRSARRRRRNAGRTYRPLFVAGAIGSGTSLLAASLAQRFAVAGVSLESAREIDPRSCLWIDRVASFDSIAAYEEKLRVRPEWSAEQAREELLDLYRSKAQEPGEAFVDKGPNTNLVRASFLRRAFPDGRFAVIFRDPVANVEGFRRKWRTFAEDRLEESIRFYRAIHESFLAQAAAFPESWVAVEYEALVDRYDEILAGLAAVLGIEPSRSVHGVAARSAGHGRGLRGVEDGHIRIVRDANACSYATLDDGEIARIREGLSPIHERLRAAAAASGFAA